MMLSLGSAASGQTPPRFLAKTVLATGIVAAAAFMQRGGFALAILLVVAGITGPAVRVMNLRTNGMVDRLRSCPASKPGLVLGYAGLWSVVTLAALAPAIAIAGLSSGPAVIAPAVTGSVLAAGVGTLCGLAARTLGDVHLLAIAASLPLVAGAVLPGPWSLFLPYASVAAGALTPLALASQIGLAACCLALLGGIAARW